jgi:hypothetical protein
LRHTFGREALLKPRAHALAINLLEFRDGLFGCGFAVNDDRSRRPRPPQEPSQIECDDRCAAGHGFDHHQLEWLVRSTLAQPTDRPAAGSRRMA